MTDTAAAPVPNATDWVCVTTNLKKTEVSRWLFDLACEGIPAKVFVQADDTGRLNRALYHVAVPAIDASSPRLWLLSIRGSDGPARCSGSPTLKHAPEEK